MFMHVGYTYYVYAEARGQIQVLPLGTYTILQFWDSYKLNLELADSVGWLASILHLDSTEITVSCPPF